MEEKPKKKQKPKPGKVVRLSKQTWELIEKRRKHKKETVDAIVRKLAGLPLRGQEQGTKTFFILPESGIVLTKCKSLAEARGAATLIAVKKNREEPERPVIVREVV